VSEDGEGGHFGGSGVEVGKLFANIVMCDMR
jgi:hypothetical protein